MPLLGVLNSSSSQKYVENNSIPLAGGAYQYLAETISKIPIPEYSDKTAPIYQDIDVKVKAILATSNETERKRLEAEIDFLVERLYSTDTLAPSAFNVLFEGLDLFFPDNDNNARLNG